MELKCGKYNAVVNRCIIDLKPIVCLTNIHVNLTEDTGFEPLFQCTTVTMLRDQRYRMTCRRLFCWIFFFLKVMPVSVAMYLVLCRLYFA